MDDHIMVTCGIDTGGAPRAMMTSGVVPTLRYCMATFAGLFIVAVGASAKVDGPVIGIDLGTTYSCVGIFRAGRAEIVPNDQGNRVTPSYVAFTEDQRLIGEAAKNQAMLNPSQTLFDMKRLIGRRFTDTTVQQEMHFLPFEIVDNGGKPAVNIKVKGENKLMHPEEVSAMILGKMKEVAEAYLGTQVKHAVVTVPAQFTDAQRQATKDAGKIAGIEVLRVVNEPTAAAIAYGLEQGAPGQTILVYDLGGGTFDVSLLRLGAGGVFEVLAVAGDAHLGGEDFDRRVVEYLVKVFKKKNGKDISQHDQALQKLRIEVEKAKRRLSSTQQAPIRVEALYENIDFAETLTRARFEQLNAGMFEKTLGPVKQVLVDASLQKDQVDQVVLVGGSTRIPKVQQLIKDFFDGKEPARGVNPDEAVAIGAALQGGAHSGERNDQELVLIDVAPLSLGVETIGGVMTKVIDRNTPLPAKNTTVLSTYRDNQRGLSVQVYQGERLMTKNNHRLGELTIRGIAPAPRGKPQVEVTFDIDENGLLSVSALDRDSGTKEQLSVSSENGRLTNEQMEDMIRDAEMFAAEDVAAQEKATARAVFDTYLHSQRLTMEAGAGTSSAMSDEDRREVMAALMDGQDWLDANPEADANEVREKQSEVESICARLLAGQSSVASTDGSSSEEDVDSLMEEL